MSSKTLVQCDNAPAAIGPYSQAVIANGLVYTAGVIPLDPETMEIVGSTIEEQAERVMQSLKALLTDAKSDLDHVIKTTCFLVDLGDFAAFNDVYSRYFTESKPARSTFQVAALPKYALVEIEAIALLVE
ncbi:MAG: RidA family protein [Chloroflexia bacterium]|jgi:2-iminobutanoate/2-iminopropanoate deaminase|nr:RidA family protein [Chloroflexia bacterium]MDQ3614702.1 RidA family protein [Chloroflexota bacterium]